MAEDQAVDVSRPRTWRSRAGIVAVVLIAVQAGWRGVLVGRSFFTQDDYLLVRLGRAPFSGDLLLQDYAGHLFPGNFALAWVHARLGPLDWSAFAVEILLMQTLAAVLAWLVLSRILPGSWARIPLLCVTLFCPLTLWPTAWWAAAIGFLPVSIALLTATWALLVHLQDGARWAPYLVVGAVFAGLLFQERALLIPIALAFVAVAWSPMTGWRAVLDAVRSRWQLWTALGGLMLTYLVVHSALAPIDSTPIGSTRDGLDLFSNFVVRTFVPGLMGGPWNPRVVGDSLLYPEVYAIVLPWVVFVAIVVWTLRRSRGVGWGWLLLVAYVLADAVLLFGGRTSLGSALALSPRYAADIVPVLPVALGLVARAMTRSPRPTRPRSHVRVAALRRRFASTRRGGAALVAGTVLAYLASSAVTTFAVAGSTLNSSDREFVETLRGQLRDQPDVVVYDATPPEGIMTFWFGSDARVSTLVGLAPERPLFDVPSYDLRFPDGEGRLRPIELVGASGMVPTDNATCGYPVGPTPVAVPLENAVEGERVVVRIVYFTSAPGTLRIQAGESDEVAPLRSSVNTLYVVVSGRVDEVTLTLQEDLDDGGVPSTAPPGTVCAVNLAVGFPAVRGGTS